MGRSSSTKGEAQSRKMLDATIPSAVATSSTSRKWKAGWVGRAPRRACSLLLRFSNIGCANRLVRLLHRCLGVRRSTDGMHKRKWGGECRASPNLCAKLYTDFFTLSPFVLRYVVLPNGKQPKRSGKRKNTRRSPGFLIGFRSRMGTPMAPEQLICMLRIV